MYQHATNITAKNTMTLGFMKSAFTIQGITHEGHYGVPSACAFRLPPAQQVARRKPTRYALTHLWGEPIISAYSTYTNHALRFQNEYSQIHLNSLTPFLSVFLPSFTFSLPFPFYNLWVCFSSEVWNYTTHCIPRPYSSTLSQSRQCFW
jgi:hypothetical protein